MFFLLHDKQLLLFNHLIGDTDELSRNTIIQNPQISNGDLDQGSSIILWYAIWFSTPLLLVPKIGFIFHLWIYPAV